MLSEAEEHNYGSLAVLAVGQLPSTIRSLNKHLVTWRGLPQHICVTVPQ